MSKTELKIYGSDDYFIVTELEMWESVDNKTRRPLACFSISVYDKPFTKLEAIEVTNNLILN